MATSIDRVRRAVSQTPWAIMPEKLEQICEFLALRAEGHLSESEVRAAVGSGRSRRATQSGDGVAVLAVHGTVSHRAGMMSDFSGGASTEGLGRAFDRYMADPEIGTIVLDVDSPGGAVPGVMEFSEKIFSARGQGKRIVAVANSLAASAAYWIATAADELVVTPSGFVGSVGVYTVHTDMERALDQAGIRTTLIRAGAHKAERSPHERLSEDARAHAQAEVDEIYQEFVEAVARNRGVSVSRVEADFGQGRVFKAKRAVEVGMADRIATLEEVLAELGVSGMQESEPARPGQRQRAEAASTLTGNAGTALVVRAQTVTTGAVVATPVEAASATITEPAPEAKENTVDGPNTTAAVNTGAAQAVPSVQVGADMGAERARAQAISELCSMHGIGGEAASFIASGASVQEVVGQIHARAAEGLEAMRASHVEMSEREQRRYSINRAILATAERTLGERASADDGFEREISEHIRQRLPRDYQSKGGFFAPMAVLNAGTAAAGGNTVFTRPGEFIDMLRARMKVAELGATILTGLEGGGPIAFPKQATGGTWSWVAENPGADVTPVDATFAQVLLNPKSGQSATAYTRQLLAQSSIDVESFVRGDMSLASALGIDAAAINGAPGGDSPTGILNTAGVGSVAIGTNGGVPTFEHMVELETEIAVDNADIGTMAYLTTPGIRGRLKLTQEFAGTNGKAVWTGGKEGLVNGYDAHVSTQVPSNLTKGTADKTCHAVIFGVWSQLLVGYWGSLEVVVDPYTKKNRGLIEVTNFQTVGVAVRHAEAFAVIKDALRSGS